MTGFKLRNKVMGLALATTLAVTSVFGGTTFQATTVSAAETQTIQPITVHFEAPASWGSGVYTYEYSRPDGASAGNNQSTKALGEWPGTAMTSEGNNWYSMTYTPANPSSFVIFNNGKSGTEAKQFPPNSGVKGKDDAASVQNGTTMYFTLSSDQLVSSATAPASYVGNTSAPAPTNPVTNMYTVHFKNPHPGDITISNLSVHYTVNGGSEQIASAHEDSVNTGWFYADVPVSSDTRVWFTSGTHAYPDANERAADGRCPGGFQVAGETYIYKDTNSTDFIAQSTAPYGFVATTPTPEVTATPVVTEAPTATPVVTEAPTATPVVTEAPTATPVVTEAPTATPVVTEAPTATPVVTEAPTATPVVTEVPTATPVVTVTPDNSEGSPAPTSVVIIITAPPVANNAVSGATVTTAPAATLAANITFSKENASAGEVVTVKANLVNAKQGATYTYSFLAGDKTLADKTTANTTKWTTSTKGEYDVQVVVYENGTPVLTSTVKYTVTKRVITIKSIKAKTTKKKGKKILTITTKATATAGKPKYKIVLKKKNGKKVASKGYSAKNQLVWKKAKKGTYKVTVTVKNGKGVVVSKTKTVKVK